MVEPSAVKTFDDTQIEMNAVLRARMNLRVQAIISVVLLMNVRI